MEKQIWSGIKMRKPEKKELYRIGAFYYNQACDDWQAYHDWFVKEKCVLKEDLPSMKEIKEMVSNFVKKVSTSYEFTTNTTLNTTKAKSYTEIDVSGLSQIIAERIGRRRIVRKDGEGVSYKEAKEKKEIKFLWRDLLAVPFWALAQKLELLALNVGGKWTAKLIVDSIVDSYKKFNKVNYDLER